MSGLESPPELQRSWCVKGHIRSGVISSVLMQQYQRTVRQSIKGKLISPRWDIQHILQTILYILRIDLIPPYFLLRWSLSRIYTSRRANSVLSYFQLGDEGLSSGGTKLNSIFITVEVVPFEEQSDDLKKKLAKTNEAKMVLYNAFPKKEYERLFMCITAKDIWQSLLITHQGNSQVKDNKIDLFVQQCKQFTILEEESIGSNFARFNTIITSLKALDEGVSSKNYVRKFIRAVHPKWIAKVTAIEESKDLSSQALDKLI
ncbi:hypothetical protein Tco_0905345, partial [Tanacetum coccineum]